MSVSVSLRARQGQVFRLGQFVKLLEMSAADLDEHLGEIVGENPMLILHPRAATAASPTDVLEMTAVEDPGSLYAHVFRELAGLLAQGGLMERVITILIEELEPSGWLARPVTEIAQGSGLSTELVEAALAMVQKRVEPVGLFARDLQDCLRLQLEDRGQLSDDMRRVLDNLAVLERSGVDGLAAAAGLETEEVSAHLVALRGLDPKPGSAFSVDPTLNRAPDVRLTPVGEDWEIEFLCGRCCDLEVASLPRGAKSAATSEALAQARSLARALDIRMSAMRQVVAQVVARQGEYFRLGDRALAPMTQSEIAAATGFHLSTVSRVLKGLLIEGPNGIVEARTLCAKTVSAQAAQSKPQVIARIRNVLEGEDPRTPLSDRMLTAILQAEGIAVSRRVVSNYRQEIGILAASKRRLRA